MRSPCVPLLPRSRRAIFGLWFGLVWLTCVGESAVPPTGPCRFILFLRCLFGVLGISCNWFVLTQMPLSDATVIIFTAPLFTALFGQLFLGEKVSAAMGALMALSSVGVLMVARPSFLGFEPDPMPPYASTSRGVAVLIGIGGALSSAMTNLAVRKLLQVHAMVTVSWLFIANLAVAPALLMLTQTPVVPTKTSTWLIAVGIGIVGFAGQGFKTQGLKWEKAGPGAMMRNLDIVYGSSAFEIATQCRPTFFPGANLTSAQSLRRRAGSHAPLRRRPFGAMLSHWRLIPCPAPHAASSFALIFQVTLLDEPLHDRKDLDITER